MDAALTETSLPSEVATETTGVRLEEVGKTYSTAAGEVIALRDISWSVPGGSAVAIMGPSGCGKTTLLNMLGGMDRPTGGRIWVGDTDVTGMNERALEAYRLRQVGFVFQFFNLIPSLSAFENLELPMVLAGIPQDQRRGRATSLLATVGLLEKGHKRPDELSGGEQQRVAICLALVNDPPLILADEPTGNLDSANVEIITDLLVSLSTKRGKTVIVSCHDPKVVEAFPKVYRMRDGVFVE
jgi:putative ABC transport system ATP-binding protein